MSEQAQDGPQQRWEPCSTGESWEYIGVKLHVDSGGEELLMWDGSDVHYVRLPPHLRLCRRAGLPDDAAQTVRMPDKNAE